MPYFSRDSFLLKRGSLDRDIEDLKVHYLSYRHQYGVVLMQFHRSFKNHHIHNFDNGILKGYVFQYILLKLFDL